MRIKWRITTVRKSYDRDNNKIPIKSKMMVVKRMINKVQVKMKWLDLDSPNQKKITKTVLMTINLIKEKMIKVKVQNSSKRKGH